MRIELSLFDGILEKYKYISLIEMNPKEIIFEERVKMNCYYCGKYNNNWKCPPNLPNINYPKMFSEFERGIFVILKMPVCDNNYNEVRNISSVKLHKAILEMEKLLWMNNDSTVVSFIGGSCKLCKNGCGELRCNNPYMSRTPLEAIGVSVNKTLQKYGIDLIYPPKDYMYRIGLVLFE